jgi:hypothetical protein
LSANPFILLLRPESINASTAAAAPAPGGTAPDLTAKSTNADLAAGFDASKFLR